jgi:hypothetical protein
MTADMSPSTQRRTEPRREIVTTASQGLHQVCERIEPDGHTVERRPGDLTTEMAVKQAGTFMRTGARGSPSWPGRKLMGRIHCSRLLATNWNQSACRPGAGHTFGRDSHGISGCEYMDLFMARLSGRSDFRTRCELESGKANPQTATRVRSRQVALSGSLQRQLPGLPPQWVSLVNALTCTMKFVALNLRP